jgi:hypothetical protein
VTPTVTIDFTQNPSNAVISTVQYRKNQASKNKLNLFIPQVLTRQLDENSPDKQSTLNMMSNIRPPSQNVSSSNNSREFKRNSDSLK